MFRGKAVNGGDVLQLFFHTRPTAGNQGLQTQCDPLTHLQKFSIKNSTLLKIKLIFIILCSTFMVTGSLKITRISLG